VAAFLQIFAWLACVVYSTIPAFWLAIHPFAGYWRRQRSNPFRTLIPLWLGLWIAIALVTSPWRRVALYATPWSWLPAVLLLLTGLWLYRSAGAGFSWLQVSGIPEIRGGTAATPFAASGIREHLRHPIYLAHLLEMLAWSVGSGLVVCFALTGIAILTGAWMIGAEDRELENRFGAEYRLYKQRVPAIFPRRVSGKNPYTPN
jgi:protein-S-isoprenylcysteine O-methyltransferase Ste14